MKQNDFIWQHSCDVYGRERHCRGRRDHIKLQWVQLRVAITKRPGRPDFSDIFKIYSPKDVFNQTKLLLRIADRKDSAARILPNKGKHFAFDQSLFL